MTFQDFSAEWRSDKPYITAHTSGSTGTPKEIRLGKEFVRESAMRTNRFFGIDSSWRLHSPLAADYIAGKMMLVRALEAGAAFSWETPSNRPLSSIGPDETIDLLAVVPSQLQYLCDTTNRLPAIRHIIVGGSAVDEALELRVIERHPEWKVYATYGMTETASHIALRRFGEASFEPFGGISVNLDSRGCLVIASGNDSFRTNDIAEIDADGRFRIIGRADNVIITGGKKVHPEEIESALRSHFGTDAFLITSRPDPKWSQRIVLLTEVSPSLKPAIDEFFIAIEPYLRPKEINFVESLERTASGKIKRTKQT